MKIFFIFLILQIFYISEILSQTCGRTKNPKSKEDCLVGSSTNSLCCFMKTNLENDTDYQCIFVPKSQIFITPHIQSFKIGKDDDTEIIEMQIECGFEPAKLPKNAPYSYCNTTFEQPTNPYQCINNSLPNSTCCFIRNPNNNSYCVFNNGLYRDNNTFFGVEIVCKGFFINFRKLLFFLFLLLFL